MKQTRRRERGRGRREENRLSGARRKDEGKSIERKQAKAETKKK